MAARDPYRDRSGVSLADPDEHLLVLSQRTWKQ
ncbi:hypothetical protein [Brachybacterium sp. UNK5269]